jgi:DHA1 family inner membrane transport protein
VDDERRLLLSADAALACVGLYVGALGPSLSAFADDAGVSLGTAGLLLTALAFGSVGASGAVTLRLHRFSQRRVAAAGMAAMSVAMLGFGLFDMWPLLLAVAVVVGASGGLADAGTHGIAATATRPAVAVSRLNVAFALGAIVGPAWAGVVLQFLEARWLVFAGAGAVAALVAVALFTADDTLRPPGEAPPQLQFGRVPAMALAMGGLLFLYVGAEIGLGAWTTAFTRRAADASLLAGALVTSGYWFALFLGRVANGMLIDRGWDPARVLVAAIAGAGAGSLVLVAGGHLLAVGAAGAFIAGFCFGPVWPCAMAIALRTGNASTPAMLVTTGNGGGIILPWIQGRVLVDGGTRAGMGMSATLCAGMLAIALAAGRRGR